MRAIDGLDEFVPTTFVASTIAEISPFLAQSRPSERAKSCVEYREPMPTPLTEGHGRSTGLVDVLDRVLDKGLVVAGDIKVSLAEVELLTIRIRLLICSIDKARADRPRLVEVRSPSVARQAGAVGRERRAEEAGARARTAAGVADAARRSPAR